MDFQKLLNNYLKEKRRDNSNDMINLARAALRRSGRDEYEVLTENGKIVLLNLNKDISSGIILENNAIVDFKNTEDFDAVAVEACARCNLLQMISSGEDLQKLKEYFQNRRTWVIHYVTNPAGFEAHTHGMGAYFHPEFRIVNDIGKNEVAYLFNSLCKSIQRGNYFRDEDKIENLYDNCDVQLKKSDDGFFDITFVERSVTGI